MYEKCARHRSERKLRGISRRLRLAIANRGTRVYLLALVLYGFGVWLHIPYGGGHIYSDIVTVFQSRECASACPIKIPYLQAFVEYPVITSMFIYAMAVLGTSFPGGLLQNYYYFTSLLLLIPSLLLLRETQKIASAVGVEQERVTRYFVATPTFVVMTLLNWYVIGVYLATFGIRKFLEGKASDGACLLGLSAASNLVTVVPALGLLLTLKGWLARVRFCAVLLGTYTAVNLPFLVLNPKLWLDFWAYHSNWYIEGSWMLALMDNLSPLRRYLFPFLFVLFFVGILGKHKTQAGSDPLMLSGLFTFAFLFSTYVATPQMNLMLLPFFVLIPAMAGYPEFLAFDIVNSLVIVLGFSQPLLIFGISLQISQFGFSSPIQWLAIARSLWIGRFEIPRLLPVNLDRVSALGADFPAWISPRFRLQHRTQRKD